jgi:hypothetical protein
MQLLMADFTAFSIRPPDLSQAFRPRHRGLVQPKPEHAQISSCRDFARNSVVSDPVAGSLAPALPCLLLSFRAFY